MKNLYNKLFQIQKLELSVSKDGKNPHFKSAYPTLDNVISVIVPEANKIGLMITHFVDGDYLVTRVVDTESGETLDSKYQMTGTTPQQRGSEQTYFRRYSMIALFNLPTEDDDGNLASTPAPAQKAWITDANIKEFAKALREGTITASSSDEAVKIARQYYAVSKASEAKIIEEYKKIGL